MSVLAAALAGMVAAGGMVLTVAAAAGQVPDVRRAQSSTGLWTATVDRFLALPPRTRLLLPVAGVSAVAVGVWTGWPVLVVVVPLAVVGIPHLLSAPRHAEMELLEALDRWVRAMASTMSTGRSITDALRFSARHAPTILQEPLTIAVRRLDDRWPTDQALLGLADELDSPDADAVLASLALAARRGGQGTVATLSALADTIQDRLRALREIEAERAKPRVVVRQVTVVTLVVLGLALLFGRSFFLPYGTPLGQTILAVLLAAYAGSLVMLRRMTLPRRRARILRSQR